RIDERTDAGAVAPPREAVVVIGNFDGVHRGHQAVLREAVDIARARGLIASVLTFDPHPLSVVGQAAPPPLTTIGRRAELLARTGVDRVYVRTFDAAFAAWPPDRFMRELVRGLLRAKVVMVGENFRFGAQRQGDKALLDKLAAE